MWRLPASMRLRLYHHHDGARVAYRETGAGPPLVLLHSLGLSHREWEPIVTPLSARFRVLLPDLPLHGDSEDRPRHPYTLDWFTDVIAGFCCGGRRPRTRPGRPRPRRGGGAASAHERAHASLAAGADVQPLAPPRGVRRPASGLARRLPGRGAARPGPAAVSLPPSCCSGRRPVSGCPRSETRPPAT